MPNETNLSPESVCVLGPGQKQSVGYGIAFVVYIWCLLEGAPNDDVPICEGIHEAFRCGMCSWLAFAASNISMG
jgi:hypothetical protein